MGLDPLSRGALIPPTEHEYAQPFAAPNSGHAFAPHTFEDPFDLAPRAPATAVYPSADLGAFAPVTQSAFWPLSQQQLPLVQAHAPHIGASTHPIQSAFSQPFYPTPPRHPNGNPLPPTSNSSWPPRPRLALGRGPVIARRIARRVYGLDADEWSRGKRWPKVVEAG